jgi:hypothetical protein
MHTVECWPCPPFDIWYLLGSLVTGRRPPCSVPRRSVHRQTNHATIQPTEPHSPSTQRTVCYDNSPLWHSYTYTIRSGISRPLWLRGGQFVTRNMLSTPYYLSCDIMSTLSWTEMWMFRHRIFLTRCMCVCVWVHLPLDQCAVCPHLT